MPLLVCYLKTQPAPALRYAPCFGSFHAEPNPQPASIPPAQDKSGLTLKPLPNPTGSLLRTAMQRLRAASTCASGCASPRRRPPGARRRHRRHRRQQPCRRSARFDVARGLRLTKRYGRRRGWEAIRQSDSASFLLQFSPRKTATVCGTRAANSSTHRQTLESLLVF